MKLDSKRLWVWGMHFFPSTGPLEEVNAFRLAHKPPRFLFFLATGAAIPLLMIYALYRLAKARVRRKWLWAIFVVFWLGTLQLDWTEGRTSFSPLSQQLFGFGMARPGPYYPWIVTIAFPVGALVFLLTAGRGLEKGTTDSPSPQVGPAGRDRSSGGQAE